MVPALLQMRKESISVSREAEEMEEYTPEFRKEMEEIIAGEHIRIPDDMTLLEYIMSLPDDEYDE